MLIKIKQYLFSSLRVLGLSILADVIFLLIFLLFSNFSTNTAYILQKVFVFAIILGIGHITLRLKMHKEIKAAIAVIPLQIGFLFFSFLFEYMLLCMNNGSLRSNGAILNWLLSLIVPLSIIIYLLLTKKYWQYILSVFVAFFPLIYIFSFRNKLECRYESYDFG